MDNTVSRNRETGQKKTKSTAGRVEEFHWAPLSYGLVPHLSKKKKLCKLPGRVEDNFIRVTCSRDRKLTAPNITAQLNQCHEKICRHLVREDGLYGRIAVNKSLLRKQNNVKRLQWVKTIVTRQVSSRIKTFGLTNQSSKSLLQIGGSMCGEEMEKSCNIQFNTNRKAGKSLC